MENLNVLDGAAHRCEVRRHPHRMHTDAITFLGAATVAGSKRFTPAGTTQYACGAGPFAVLRVSVTSLEDAAQYLTACPANAFAVRGRAIGDVPVIPYRRFRPKPGLPPTIEADPTHRLLPIDIDDDGRRGLDLEANARWYRDSALPDAFRGAACLAMATSSAGLKSGSRMRLWFWCSRPVTDAEATAWLHSYDVAIYRPAQPIYCAAPTFDGVEDPFAGRARAVWLPGADVAVPDVLPSAPPRTRAPSASATPAGGRNTFLTSLAGTLRRKGASEGVLLATLLAANEEFPEPLDDEEVEAIARSIANYDPSDVAVTVAAKPVNEKARQEAERTLKRVAERVKDDPASWRTHVEALGPHLASGAITPGVVAARAARAFGDASTAVTVTEDELRAAVDTLSSEGHAIATVQESWLADKGAILTKEGDGLVPCPKNMAIVLEHAPDLQGIRWDPRFGRVRVWSAPWTRHGKQPGDQWANTDESALRAWMCDYGWMKSPDGLYDAVERAATARPFDWWSATLDHCAAQWDGVVRLQDPTFVSRVLGCDPSAEACEYFRKWLISAVARAFTPGAKVDIVLVLFSKQGHSKGRLLHALLGVGDGVLTRGADYYGELTERSRDFNDKDVLAKLGGKAIVEVGENTALASRDQSSVKAFLSARTDEYRAPWERKPSAHPRTFVLVVTTNEEDIFSDLTGNRRYKVITCARAADVDFAHAHMSQIWGEAVNAYRAGETYHYVGDDTSTEGHTVADPWVDALRLAIARNPQHLGLDLLEGGRLIGLRARDALALLDIPTTQQTQATARRAGACLRVLGWRSDVRRVGGACVRAFWLDTPATPCDVTA